MRKLFTERRRVAFYLDEDDYKALEKASGGNLSAYIRELLQDQGVVDTVILDGAFAQSAPTATAIQHHPRCSCLKCKPKEKK